MTETAQDFDSMSEDDLLNFIASKNEAEESDPEPDEEKSEVVKPEISNATSPTESEDKPEDSDDLPFYKGKDRKALIDMQENAKKKISQQENEMHKLRLEMENLKGQIQAIKSPEPKKDPFQERIAHYDKDDVSVIEEIAERKIREKEEARRREQEEKARKAQEANDAHFRVLTGALSKVYPPEVVDKITDDFVSAVKSDPENTFNKEGWVMNFWNSYQAPNQEGQKQTGSNETVVKRKLSAATVGGGNGSGVNVGKPKKSVESMTADEYVDYMAAQGVDIRRGVAA